MEQGNILVDSTTSVFICFTEFTLAESTNCIIFKHTVVISKIKNSHIYIDLIMNS